MKHKFYTDTPNGKESLIPLNLFMRLNNRLQRHEPSFGSDNADMLGFSILN